MLIMINDMFISKKPEIFTNLRLFLMEIKQTKTKPNGLFGYVNRYICLRE